MISFFKKWRPEIPRWSRGFGTSYFYTGRIYTLLLSKILYLLLSSYCYQSISLFIHSLIFSIYFILIKVLEILWHQELAKEVDL